MKNDDVEELRNRRSEAAAERERLALRAAHGERLVGALQAVTEGLALEDFDLDREGVPFRVDWPPRLEDADGLVAAYVTRWRAASIAQCLASRSHEQSGLIGIYGNDYLGYCFSSQVSVKGMLRASEMLNEPVVFYPGSNDGAIIFDVYASNPGGAYSVIVQGERLVEALAGCFRD